MGVFVDIGSWFARLFDWIIKWGGIIFGGFAWLWDGIKNLPSFGIAFAGACVATITGWMAFIRTMVDTLNQKLTEMATSFGTLGESLSTSSSQSTGAGLDDWVGLVGYWVAGDQWLAALGVVLGVYTAVIVLKFLRSVVPVV